MRLQSSHQSAEARCITSSDSELCSCNHMAMQQDTIFDIACAPRDGSLGAIASLTSDEGRHPQLQQEVHVCVRAHASTSQG